MKDKKARSQIGWLAKAVERNLDRVTSLRKKDELTYTALVALTKRVEALEALQWTPEEVLGVPQNVKEVQGETG